MKMLTDNGITVGHSWS